jgi:hypothetical protein
MGIIAEGPLAADVITSRKKIIRTTSGGRTWELAASIADKSDQQSGIRQFGMTGNRFWVITSADSREGTRGVLTVEEAGSSFVRHGLGGVYFADGLSLSEREFLICGYTKKVEQRPQGPYWRQEGVILYSADNGNNWLVVYRNKNVKQINTLAAVDSYHIWAVGDGGLILQLKRSSLKEND